MRVAVSSQDRHLSSPVDQRFGRAPWFVVVDAESGEFISVENIQNLNAVQGAGIQAAQNVAALQVEAVLTGHCGPKAFRVLSQAGVKVFTGIEGTVAEAVARFKEGVLQESTDANVEGHW